MIDKQEVKELIKEAVREVMEEMGVSAPSKEAPAKKRAKKPTKAEEQEIEEGVSSVEDEAAKSPVLEGDEVYGDPIDPKEFFDKLLKYSAESDKNRDAMMAACRKATDKKTVRVKSIKDQPTMQRILNDLGIA